MNKTSKVKSVQANGTWEGTYGIMYKFEISFENGDVGEYSSKNQDQNKFIQGQEIEYIYTGGNYPKIKPVYTQPAPSFSNKSEETSLKIARQSSLKVACDLCIASGEIEDLLPMAERLTKWVMSGKI